MRTATITQAKNGLSALIDRVKGGETIVILDRGTPVARLEPITHGENGDGRAARLERAGLARRGMTAPPIHLIQQPGPAVPPGASVLDALLEERRTGR
ncbi:MAG: type II toxin-antitoxin system prevent-host-death family antitoxin [Candidatus Limnocylindrales bacterium]